MSKISSASSPMGLLLWIILLAPNLFGQSLSSTTVTLSEPSYSLEKLLAEIERQADVAFVFDPELINNKAVFRPAKKTYGLNELIGELASDFGWAYQINGNSISLKATDQPTIEISGRVVDAITREPLPLALVSVVNGASTTSDIDGNFKLKASVNKDSIKATYMGYEEETVLIDAKIVEISLMPSITQLTQVVVQIGYGDVFEKSTTGAIQRVGAGQIENKPVSSFEQALAGETPGVVVTQQSGAPGNSAAITIRGTGTITAGTSPLIVVDGFPTNETDLNFINPEDIASLEILKDASASAIYGSRGANGVILVTTKMGDSDKTKFQFHTSWGFQELAKKIDLMDAYEHSKFTREARDNYWMSLDSTNSESDPNSLRANSARIPEFMFPYIERQQGLTNTDWQDAIYQKGLQNNTTISASGGNEKLQFYSSVNYFDQQGIILNSNFQRITFRLNLKAKLTDKLEFGTNLSPVFSNYDLVSEKTYKKDGIVLSALMALPHFPVYEADGSYSLGDHIENGESSTVWLENPVALAKEIENTMDRAKLIGSTYLQYEPVKNLKIKSLFGVDYLSSSENYYRPSILGDYRNLAPTIPQAYADENQRRNWLSETTISHSLWINDKHNLKPLLGMTFQKEHAENTYAFATNFPNDDVHTLNAGQITDGSTDIQEWSIMSLLARMIYDYENRYMVNVTWRRDGSSRFGKNSRWGQFPSVSVGWRISEESFVPKIPGVSDLKLRFSYGLTGNNQIPNYGSVALLDQYNYVIGGGVVNGQAPVTAPNSELSWEQTKMTDIGVNASLWENRIDVTFDWYKSITDGLLLEVPVPASSGFTSSLQNIGSVQNAGIELGATYRQKINKSWKLTNTVNFSKNANEVLSLGPDQSRILNGNHLTQIGLPIGSYYGYRVLGVFESQDELESYPHLSTSAVGSYKYEDVNGDGEITDQDRTVIGDYTPDFIWGLVSSVKFKNFTLGITLQGVQGVEIFNLSRAFIYNTQGWSNGAEEIYHEAFYSSSNPGDGVSMPLSKPTDKLYESSDFMVEDGSFTRLRSLTVTYDLPQKWLEAAHLGAASIYFTGQNLWTWTKYTGYNPEVSTWNNDPTTPGVDYGAYPVAKTFMAGLKASF